jgi:hypothetical protein
MPALTRRRCTNPHQVTWHVYYGDVPVGTIGQRAGVPVDADQWQWSCGFYPGLEPGQHHHGIARTFAEARAGFEADWNWLLPEIPNEAFDEWRQDHEYRMEIKAKRDRGDRLDSEIPSSMMLCACGITFNSHVLAENLTHLPHIYAAQSQGRNGDEVRTIKPLV